MGLASESGTTVYTADAAQIRANARRHHRGPTTRSPCRPARSRALTRWSRRAKTAALEDRVASAGGFVQGRGGRAVAGDTGDGDPQAWPHPPERAVACCEREIRDASPGAVPAGVAAFRATEQPSRMSGQRGTARTRSSNARTTTPGLLLSVSRARSAPCWFILPALGTVSVRGHQGLLFIAGERCPDTHPVASAGDNAFGPETRIWDPHSPPPHRRPRPPAGRDRRLRRRRRAALGRAPARKRAPLARPRADTLAPHELQVATLVAQGCPNREVAGQLFVSPRTIEVHLRNVFSKVGISSRGELAGANCDDPRRLPVVRWIRAMSWNGSRRAPLPG
jgi:DNA-binding CsgD family transcriptional regulator